MALERPTLKGYEMYANTYQDTDENGKSATVIAGFNVEKGRNRPDAIAEYAVTGQELIDAFVKGPGKPHLQELLCAGARELLSRVKGASAEGFYERAKACFDGYLVGEIPTTGGRTRDPWVSVLRVVDVCAEMGIKGRKLNKEKFLAKYAPEGTDGTRPSNELKAAVNAFLQDEAVRAEVERRKGTQTAKLDDVVQEDFFE